MVATHEDRIRKLDELIRGIDVAMLTTAMPDGTLRSRPLVTLHTPFDGTLWFFTHVPSGTSREIGSDEHVNISYVDPRRGRYVSVSGRASIERDRARTESLWRPELAAWFPSGVDDPGVALLRITVTDAEYWDSPAGAVNRLGGLIRSAVGARPSEGEHEKIHVDEGDGGPRGRGA